MLTKDQLDTIAKFMSANAPNHHYLAIMIEENGTPTISIVSNLHKDDQVQLAKLLVTGYQNVATGGTVEVPLTKPH